MSLDEKFAPVEILYEGVSHILKKNGLLGYPESGMPTIYEMPSKLYARSQFVSSKTPNILAASSRPENWFEMILDLHRKLILFLDL
jgi:hypothetical protein